MYAIKAHSPKWLQVQSPWRKYIRKCLDGTLWRLSTIEKFLLALLSKFNVNFTLNPNLIFLTLTFPKFTYMWFRVKRNLIPQFSPKSMRQDLNSLDSFSFSFAHLGLHVSQLQPFFFNFQFLFKQQNITYKHYHQQGP